MSNIPIVVGKDGYVIDGRHRALRAINEGTSIEAYISATDIWNKSQELKQEATDPLIAEARKYASSKEFVDSQKKGKYKTMVTNKQTKRKKHTCKKQITKQILCIS